MQEEWWKAEKCSDCEENSFQRSACNAMEGDSLWQITED